MKRFSFNLVAALAIVSLVVGTTVYLAGAAETKAVAVMIKTVGQVQAKQKKGWLKVDKGSKLFSGDEVQTKKDGYAAVMFLDDKSTVKVKPNSVLKIQGNYEGKTISKQLVMDVGELLVKVSKQKGSFQVATPTSVASVKGTEFWIIEDPNGTKIIGLEGIIELMNKASGQTSSVGVGQTGTTGSDGSVTITTTQEGDIPDAGQLQEEIKIKFRDADGNEKELKIKY